MGCDKTLLQEEAARTSWHERCGAFRRMDGQGWDVVSCETALTDSGERKDSGPAGNAVVDQQGEGHRAAGTC